MLASTSHKPLLGLPSFQHHFSVYGIAGTVLRTCLRFERWKVAILFACELATSRCKYISSRPTRRDVLHHLRKGNDLGVFWVYIFFFTSFFKGEYMRWAFLIIHWAWMGSLLLRWSEYKANLRHAMNSTGHPDHNDVFNFVIWPKLEYLAQYFVSSVYPHKSFFPLCFEHDNVLGRCSFTLTSCLTTHTIIAMQIVNFSASNSHFTNESSSNETTQLVIALTRVLPFKQFFSLLELLHLLFRLLYRLLLDLELRHVVEQLPHVLLILSHGWNK